MATDAVHQYLRTQNRPYNANDIVNNLNQEFSKTVVQKSLDKLIVRKKIFEKTYSKQKVYCIIQDNKQDPEELTRIQRELDRHLSELLTKKLEVEREFRSKEAELAALKSSLTLEDAKVEINRLRNSVNNLVNKFESLIKTNGSEDLKETKKRVIKQTEIYTREYSKRKRLCGEIIESILEGFPGTKKGLYEEIGIEIVNV